MMKLFFLVYFLFYVVSAAYSADDCTFIDGSNVQQSKETLNRLAPLGSLVLQSKVTVDGKETNFKFCLCCNPNPGHCRAYSSVVMETEGNVTTIGLYNETEIVGGDNWITLTLSGGDAISSDHRCNSVKAQSVINVVCDPTRTQDQFDVIHFPSLSDDRHPAHCFYSFLLSQTSVCEAKHEQIKEGVSGGTVICILFFTITGVYFVFGFLYRRIVVRAKGLEQIPNYDFWREFGNLQADGCDFVCRCGGRQEAKMYQGIDDPLGSNDRSDVEDRDDRLLPM